MEEDYLQFQNLRAYSGQAYRRGKLMESGGEEDRCRTGGQALAAWI